MCLALSCGCDPLKTFNCFQTDNRCLLPPVILSEASRSQRDAQSKSLSRTCRGACPELAEGNLPPSPHHPNRPHPFNHHAPSLYIRARKSFVISKNLYIQNGKPFVMSESLHIPKKAYPARPSHALIIFRFVYTRLQVLYLQPIFVYTEWQALCYE